MGLCTGNSFVRIAGVVIAGGGRLPIFWDDVEYYFLDSACERSLDRGMASISGSVAGNCGRAGGDNALAAGEENGLSGPQRCICPRLIRDTCSAIVRELLPRCSFAIHGERSARGERRAPDRATTGSHLQRALLGRPRVRAIRYARAGPGRACTPARC